MAKHNKYVVGLLALSISTSFLGKTSLMADELKNDISIVGSTKFLDKTSLLEKNDYNFIHSKENHNREYTKAESNSQGVSVVNGIEWVWAALNDGTISVRPSNIEDIGEEVVIPASINNYEVTEIAESAFELCKNLKMIILPDTINVIGESAFSGCKGLKEIILPRSVSEIKPFVFSSSGIEKIIIPDNVKRIQGETFWNCAELKAIKLPSKLNIIEEEAFSRCSSLKSIIIPKEVIEIENDAFSYCGLTDVIILDGLEKINDCTFKGCSNLETITIPDSVKEIGEEAFIGCLDNIKTIYCNDESCAKAYFDLD